MLSTGWKDILRPIRDGIGRLFPPDEPPAETPEQRRKRRHADALGGFTYFEDFDELDAWQPSHADQTARSNIPLLERSGHSDKQRGKAKVLLIHDASGNYHDYESNQGADLEYERYTCRYLRYVETFVYFSHKLVCIPPPTWTNTLHRNGVKSLGTVLIESQTPGAERLLQSTLGSDIDGHDIANSIAAKLVKLADTYGFDGWLINIEKPFAADVWDSEKLINFLEQLRKALQPYGQVVWYDALTAANKVEYQNALTEKNLAFASAAGSVLLNYTWNERAITESHAVAERHQMDATNVYFGIDVWAQNKQHGLRRRVTYPSHGGGGTNTGVAVAKLAEHGFSAGVFAPAWSYEHFPAHGQAVERAMWEGCQLPDSLVCSCGDQDSKQHRTSEYESHPIYKYAYEYPTSSDWFFYTSFKQAFRDIEEQPIAMNGTARTHSQIGSQDPTPLLIGDTALLHGRINVLPHDRPKQRKTSRNVLEIFALRGEGPQSQPAASLRLFNLDMAADGSLRCALSVSLDASKPAAAYVKMWLAFAHGEHSENLPLNEVGDTDFHVLKMDVSCPCTSTVSATSGTSTCRLLGIGIRVEKPFTDDATSGATPLLMIKSLRIAPPYHHRTCAELYDLRLEHNGESNDEKPHWRIKWDWRWLVDAENDWTDTDGKHSLLTRLCGPFSYFVVTLMDGGREEVLNDVFACEVVLHARWTSRLDEGEALKVAVEGMDLGGRLIGYGEGLLEPSNEPGQAWELVN